jgi:hypothetical protein
MVTNIIKLGTRYNWLCKILHKIIWFDYEFIWSKEFINWFGNSFEFRWELISFSFSLNKLILFHCKKQNTSEPKAQGLGESQWVPIRAIISMNSVNGNNKLWILLYHCFKVTNVFSNYIRSKYSSPIACICLGLLIRAQFLTTDTCSISSNLTRVWEPRRPRRTCSMSPIVKRIGNLGAPYPPCSFYFLN